MATPAHHMSDLFTGNDRALFESVRHTDPEANLVQRWEKILFANPSLAQRRLGYVPMVIENGWAVVALPDEGFAYTIGLQYHFGQPELLIAAPHLSSAELQERLNAIGRYVQLHAAEGEQGPIIRAGEPVDLTDFELSLVFRPYSHQVFEEKYATGYLATFEHLFEDREHTTGDTLPVLWTELSPPPAKKRKPKKTGAKRKPTRKASAAKKPAKKPKKTGAAKKPAKKPKKTGAKKKPARK